MMDKVLKSRLFAILFVFAVVSTTTFPLICSFQKPDQGKQMLEEVLNLPASLDPRVKEAVVALNLLGYKTTSSFGGSLEHRAAYPWIEIQVEQADTYQVAKELAEVTLEIEKAHGEGKKVDKGLLKEHRALYEKYESVRQMQIYPLYSLLCEYYQNPHDYDSSLILKPMDREGAYRLYSRGGCYQDLRSEEIKEEKLNRYHEEMQAFTRFLIRKQNK